MYYIVLPATPRRRQMTLEELFSNESYEPVNLTNDRTATVTYKREKITQQMEDKFECLELYTELITFNQKHEELAKEDRNLLYKSFRIPKKSGGLRRIDAPVDELKEALTELKQIIETYMPCYYHTNAFAYIGGRSTIDAVRKHQKNESKWFAKFDMSNFFGSTTLDFVMSMMRKIMPFAKVCEYPGGDEELMKALELGFYNGGLPQGTPLSPTLTNVMMVPIDYELSNDFLDFEGNRLVYTRYADDFLVSSEYDFSFKEVEKHMQETLGLFCTPFRFNERKTRYGSIAGSNWNLGLMLNKDNEITIGHKNKKRLKTMLFNYGMDKKNGIQWEINDIQEMDGYRSYARFVEKETIDAMVEHVSKKVGLDIVAEIKRDLKMEAQVAA
jgi:RNA-directed DNA polymerase